MAMMVCALVVSFSGQAFQERSTGPAGTSRTGRWKNFTDMKLVAAMTVSGDSVWAATSGGLFFYREASNQIVKFTNSEGLSSNDLTAVTVDRSGRVWIGSSEGFINGLTPHTGVVAEVRDIRESSRIQKGIRGFFVRNDSLMIAIDFGISVYLTSRNQFGDTYANFGFPSQPRVNNVLLHGNRIWGATESGVVSASLSSTNLSAPNSWTIYDTRHGLPSPLASSVVAYRDTIVVGTKNGLAFFSNGSFQRHPSFDGTAVIALHVVGSELFVLTAPGSGFSLRAISGLTGSVRTISTNSEGPATGLAVMNGASTPWVSTSFRGIAKLNNGQWTYVTPNGPQSNLFLSLAVDEQGVLWSGSGISERGKGFYRYDPAQPAGLEWKNFTVDKFPAMAHNDYYKVSVGAEGSVWVSSWGRGVVEVVKDSIVRRLDQNSTPKLTGSVPQDPNFVVIGSVAADQVGNTWIVNRTAINQNYLVRLSKDSTRYFSTTFAQGLFTNMVIDRNGTKWLANSEPTNKPPSGLYYFNETGAVSGTSSLGGWGLMTTSDGIPDRLSNIILSLAIDLDGRVCVGTDLGMFIITDPRNPKASRINSIPLQGQTVQAIVVDALNNKWVGTKEGVLVVSPDGVQLLQQYSVLTTNGKLVDNDIRSMIIDQKRGIVYIGTEKGLSSLEIAPVQTVRSFTTLEFGPNPYLVPNERQLTISNLVADSRIKILSVDGSLVTEFRAQGAGRAFWNGRDQSGLLVSSGVYFVVAFAENGNQITTGKVAVVRR